MFRVKELREYWSEMLSTDNSGDWIGVHFSTTWCNSSAVAAVAQKLQVRDATGKVKDGQRGGEADV